MKITQTNQSEIEDDDLRTEYDFSAGVRGKHFNEMQAGYTITVHQADGSTIIKEVKPNEGSVVLEADVREYFPDSAAVNTALRSLIKKRGPKKARSPAVHSSTRLASGGRSKSAGKKV